MTKSTKIKSKSRQKETAPSKSSLGNEKNMAMFGVPIRQFTGMSNDEAAKLIIRQVMWALPTDMSGEEEYIKAVVTMLHGIEPADELEGMLAAQMVAIHLISMNMSGRCMIEDQTIDAVSSVVNRTTKLMRIFTSQVEALQRYRGKGKQTIQVQHVKVNEGGQAIVGNVQGGRGQ